MIIFLKSRTAIMLFAAFLTTIIFILSLFVGSASLPFGEVIGGLFSLNGSSVGSVIMKNIRLPRALGAFLSLVIFKTFYKSCSRFP